MLEEGAQVGNYVLEAFVGSGGMSSVYRARHRALHSVHAIKVLNSELGRSAALRERFLQEGQVLAQVRHPALVRVTDVVDDGGVAGLVMDFLEGRDLAAALELGPLDVEQAANIVLQVLSGVGHAHGAGVVHRDLKPGNIFLVNRGDHRPPAVKVLDFGIAKLADSALTRGTSTMGTVAYMSPEQIEHPGQVDGRSDLFSLGVVLFEMLAGSTPFSGDTDFAIMQRIVSGERSDLPPSAGLLAPVVQRALRADPSERFPTAQAFAAAVRPLASPEVRLMVDDWEGTGEVDRGPVVELGSKLLVPASGGQSTGETLAVSDEPVVRHPDAPLEPREREVVRLMGSLQLVSGVFNIGIMSTVQCFGLGWLGGLPACFAGLLLVVGSFEVWSGLQAIAFGNRKWIRPTALLEIMSLAGAGILSTAVGVTVLFVRRQYPHALP